MKIYLVEDLQGNFLWRGPAKDAVQAEKLCRGVYPWSVASNEVLVVKECNESS